MLNSDKWKSKNHRLRYFVGKYKSNDINYCLHFCLGRKEEANHQNSCNSRRKRSENVCHLKKWSQMNSWEEGNMTDCISGILMNRKLKINKIRMGEGRKMRNFLTMYIFEEKKNMSIHVFLIFILTSKEWLWDFLCCSPNLFSYLSDEKRKQFELPQKCRTKMLAISGTFYWIIHDHQCITYHYTSASSSAIQVFLWGWQSSWGPTRSICGTRGRWNGTSQGVLHLFRS